MLDDSTKELLIAVLAKGLKGNCSDLTFEMLLGRMERSSNDMGSIKDAIKRIRAGIRLLVDEELAEDIYEELLSSVRQVEESS